MEQNKTNGIAEILKKLMDEDPKINGKQQALHRLSGATQSAIAEMLNPNTSREFKDSTLAPVANYFKITIPQLKGQRPLHQINELGAGYEIYIDEKALLGAIYMSIKEERARGGDFYKLEPEEMTKIITQNYSDFITISKYKNDK